MADAAAKLAPTVDARAAIDAVPRNYNFAADIIERHLKAGRANKPVYVDPRGSWTYGQLAERVDCSNAPADRLNRAAKREDGCIGLTLSPCEHPRVGADFHCSRPRRQGASSLSCSVPGVSRSEGTTEATLSAYRIIFQARKRA